MLIALVDEVPLPVVKVVIPLKPKKILVVEILSLLFMESILALSPMTVLDQP